jgi:hypothetical protein
LEAITIFGVDGAVVAQQEVSTNEGGLAFPTLEGALFGVWQGMRVSEEN